MPLAKRLLLEIHHGIELFYLKSTNEMEFVSQYDQRKTTHLNMTEGGLYHNTNVRTQRERNGSGIARERRWVYHWDVELKTATARREEWNGTSKRHAYSSLKFVIFNVWLHLSYHEHSHSLLTLNSAFIGCIFNELGIYNMPLYYAVCTVHTIIKTYWNWKLKTEKRWRSRSVCDKKNHFYVYCTTY